LVTGGAGFIGCHLIQKLLEKQEEVICLDNYCTGSKTNIYPFRNNPLFEVIRHDVVEPILLEVDRVWHLACPASPIHYQSNPIKTSKISFLGTYNMLGLAKRVNAQFLMASTSEIYGDPEVHPQPEFYKGSVNTFGIRACYDEGKRISETLCFDFNRIHDVDIRIARIFNTYGPKMLKNDGRVISNFIVNCLQGKSLEVNGDGNQTRSFCYVDDLVQGLIKLMDSKYNNPINLGNPSEFTIKDLAYKVIKKIDHNIKLNFNPLPQDDPMRRRPNIDLAKRELGWLPTIDIDQGLDKTIKYFREII
tara:strand:+ start:22595 stop:23509 length:915 start_codon:yes stop_codon:yes gene_type:complete